MPEGPEIETNEMQETLSELQEERREHKEEETRNSWVRYIALSTAFLAVFAAVGSLQSGSLVNEAMINQLKASDTWSEYQAARQKDYALTLQANTFLDAGIAPAKGSEKPTGSAKGGEKKAEASWKAATPPARLAEYIGRAEKEKGKEEDLMEKAKHLEEESEHNLHRHHRFAWSVSLIQVAIALSAISALTRIRAIWYASFLVGLGGIFYFFLGWLGR